MFIGVAFKVDGNGTYSKCSRYAVNWPELIQQYQNSTHIQPNLDWDVEPCYDGWEFDQSEVQSSIVIDVSTHIGKCPYNNQ